ncbi:MAG TPA: hypothetical protein VJ463_00675 [Geothrix sp.]|nr:hypothetical protein [Geothrix sp.]
MPTQAVRLERVYLVLSTGPGSSGELMSQLNSALTRHLADRGIETKGWVKNFLVIDEELKLKAELDRFQPRHLLRIDQTSVTTSGGSIVGATLDLRIDDARTGEPAWKARLSYESSSDISADLVATRIMGALREDGMLPMAGTSTK